MLFSSVIFIFQFLPFAILVYFFIPNSFRNFFLLLISLLFYAWGEPVYVLLMMGSIALNYVVGVLMDRVHPARRRWILTTGVVANLSLLIHYKYFWFITQNLNALLGWNVGTYDPLPLPIGISFYTFQSLSYLIDVYRREVRAQRSIVHLGLYIAFFPQLIAGPIIRYHDVNQQIEERKVSLTGFAYGIERFIIGLAKKVLLANTLGEVADNVFEYPDEQITVLTAWLGILCYTFQIYFDFSGYSDMAIGLGKMFGFTFQENFRHPYTARSIREFWRKWHISLSTWFRDYLYVPLGGNRVSEGRTYFNLIFVFFVTGLWHGANWNFVFWGLFHGVFLILERNRPGVWLQQAWRPVQHLYALLVIVVGWVFFRVQTVAEGFRYLKVMAGFGAQNLYARGFTDYMNPKIWCCFALAMVFSLPVDATFNLPGQRHWQVAYRVITLLLLMSMFVVSLADIASDSYNPFIYFRF